MTLKCQLPATPLMETGHHWQHPKQVKMAWCPKTSLWHQQKSQTGCQLQRTADWPERNRHWRPKLPSNHSGTHPELSEWSSSLPVLASRRRVAMKHFAAALRRSCTRTSTSRSPFCRFRTSVYHSPNCLPTSWRTPTSRQSCGSANSAASSPPRRWRRNRRAQFPMPERTHCPSTTSFSRRCTRGWAPLDSTASRPLQIWWKTRPVAVARKAERQLLACGGTAMAARRPHLT